MTLIDWSILALYMAAMIGLSVYLGRGQSDAADYYVGGRNLPWWAVGLSTMATQASAVSFVSIPGFVALEQGGGLTWLQYELAVPLAMILVMAVLAPFFRGLELISVYRYLELRFDGPDSRLPSVRRSVSAIFLLGRGLATGVVLLLSAKVLGVCLGTSLYTNIVLVGVITVVYDTIGGMAAVVYSDVIQLGVLVLGLGLCIYFATELAGGFQQVLTAFPAERWQAFRFGLGVSGERGLQLWPMLFGGLFLYTAYYGVDQSQAQRLLSAPSLDDTRRGLMLNGLARFPFTLLYVALGVAAYAAFHSSEPLRAAVAPGGQLDADTLIPHLVLQTFPIGVRAIVFAAVLAAAMSSLDSALNSLSAATLRDFIEPALQPSPESLSKLGRITTVVWGVAITAFAFVVGSDSPAVVVVNLIGSMTNGPILAAFLVGITTRRATGGSVLLGLVVGVSVNLFMWKVTPEVSGWWWNLVGCAITYGVAVLGSGAPRAIDGLTLWGRAEAGDQDRAWRKGYVLLVGYFVAMVLGIYLLQTLPDLLS